MVIRIEFLPRLSCRTTSKLAYPEMTMYQIRKTITLGLTFLLFAYSAALYAAPKNVIFILADDLGWNDTNIYQQHPIYETPNIDALASKGMTFTRSYTNSPLCSPTRASILTGQTPSRHGSTVPEHHLDPVRLQMELPTSAPSNRKSISPRTVTRLDTTLPTISSLLKQNGYQTAHFGKWHLGEAPFSPREHGFDVDIPNYGGPGPSGGYLAPWRFARNLQPQSNGEHIDIRLANEAKKWILDNHNKGPFFVNFWAFSVHTPYNASPELVNYFKNKLADSSVQAAPVYAAMIKQFDDAIGVLVEALVEAGIEDDTVIVFTSDNGGAEYTQTNGQRATSNFPLRGGKATMYEGGTRVPTFIIWPELTIPDTITDYPIQSVDYMPSILSGLDIQWPSSHAVDGKDIRFVLQGNAEQSDSAEQQMASPVFTYYTAEPRVPKWLPPSMAVTHGKWKLIRTFYYGQENSISSVHMNQLYNLDDDPTESKNLADELPETVVELSRLIDEHIVETNAVVPVANPRYVQGSFNYDTIGMAEGRFILDTDGPSIEDSFGLLRATPSITRANAGDTVTIELDINGQTTSNPVKVEQIMGTKVVDLVQSREGIQFKAPEVFIEEFIGFEFSTTEQNRLATERASVSVMPTQSAPTITVTPSPNSAVRGGQLSFAIDAIDANKDRMTVKMQSSVSGFENVASLPTKGQFSVSIPQQTQAQSLTFAFTVSDGNAETVARVTVDVVDTLPDSGGGKTTPLVVLLLTFVLIIKWRFGVIPLGKVPK